MRIVLPFLGVLLSSSLSFAEDRFALVIGANAGWANDRPLRHAEADAERMRDVLVDLGGFPSDRVQLLRDPDTAEVRSRLRSLAAHLRSLSGPSLVLLFYSGHSDEKHLHLRGLPMSLAELYESFRDLPASVRVGILDACKSGSILGAKGARPTVPFQVKVLDDLNVRGLAWVTSSGADELSQETRSLAGSVFTHHMVSALRGAADQDRNGQVTLAEAYGYAQRRTEADTAATAIPQRPAFRFDLKGQGELVLVTLARKRASLLLPKKDGERYVVVDEHEWQLLAEGHSNAQESVVLALAPGRYRVKKVLSDRLDVATVTLTDGSEIAADFLTYARHPLSAGVVKGNPDDLDPTQKQGWRRQEALRLLATGEAGTALGMFNAILKEQPEDWAARRGRARALIRMAEAYERLSEHAKERTALRDALNADPSLAEDPDFQSWYRRLQELEDQERRAEEIKAKVAAELDANPRLKRKWGLGVDLVSSRGTLAVVGTMIVNNVWFPSVAVDFMGPGIDLSARFVPFASRWSPVVGLGAHTSLATLGLTSATKSPVTINEGKFSYEEIWGKNLHADMGMQYFGPSGFSAEIGFAIILFERHNPRQLSVLPMFNLNFGFFF